MLPLAFAETYFMTHGSESIKISFTEVNRSLVNDVCQKSSKRCLALNALRSPPLKLKVPLGHPADSYCRLNKGVPLQLKNENGEERSFCVFPDQSMISSWDLFHRHFPMEKKKQRKK
jgi:putative hemolysin